MTKPVRHWNGKEWVDGASPPPGSPYAAFEPTRVVGPVPYLSKALEKQIRAEGFKRASVAVERVAAAYGWPQGGEAAAAMTTSLGIVIAQLIAESERLRRALMAEREGKTNGGVEVAGEGVRPPVVE